MSINQTIANLLSTMTGRQKLAQVMVSRLRTTQDYNTKILDVHDNYIIRLSAIGVAENYITISLKEFYKTPLNSFKNKKNKSLSKANYYINNNKLVYLSYKETNIKDFNDIEELILSEIYYNNIICNKEDFVIIDDVMIDCLRRYYNNKCLL